MTAPHRQKPIDALLRMVPQSGTSLYTEAALDANPHAVVVGGTSVPERKRLQPSQYVDSPNALASAASNRTCAMRHPGKDVEQCEPAEFTWDEGPSHLPGTAQYYRSSAFRKKKNAGVDQVPGAHKNAITYNMESDNESLGGKGASLQQRLSLVMIFSRTNVRRASDERMAHKRLQRHNRRM